ncbi:Bifunctional purine biosynthesis protein PurH [Candidatus Burarchaeum australiense]|nr:Bifunctional purine biosynthesis protein PurH [Candidatus Burarchaeum australiense]
MSQVKRALITVYDKSGIADFSKELQKLGVELISTGGTAEALRKAGLKVTEVSDITGFPELFEGRLKSLHPLIHGAILYKRGDRKHEAEAAANRIRPIDLVVVNLYPFEKEPGIEMIDVGGPALIRAAAKNSEHVGVVVEPSQYSEVLADLKANKGGLSAELKKKLMLRAFARTSEYDWQIGRHFSASKDLFPEALVMRFSKVQDLRYGENPHQKAASYVKADAAAKGASLASLNSLAGKQLSYNNLLDANSALLLIRDLRSRVATAIMKHNNPCGSALGKTLKESYEKALATDPQSAYGGVVAFSRKVDAETAEAMGRQFIEVVLAPGYEPKALEILKQKKSRRILDISELMKPAPEGETDFRSIIGGMLYQQSDYFPTDPLNPTFTVVSKRAPTPAEKKALGFAYILAKHVKSNAIVFSREDQIVGIGAGQMSRVDACRIAIEKAGDAGFDVKGTAMASDGFFPLRDTVEFAAKAGATAIIQPGGSIRDADVIAAADECGIAMAFTGVRHFKH